MDGEQVRKFQSLFSSFSLQDLKHERDELKSKIANMNYQPDEIIKLTLVEEELKRRRDGKK